MSYTPARRRQKTWRKHESYVVPWPWRYHALQIGEEPVSRLLNLKDVWESSRNYAALHDALAVVADYPTKSGTDGVTWTTRACLELMADPSAYVRWKERYRKDLLDVIRVREFEQARELDLTRDEAAEGAREVLGGTPAASTTAAISRLVSSVQAREKKTPGRYYLGAGTGAWRDQLFRNQGAQVMEAYWRLHHRAAKRGDRNSELHLQTELRYAKKNAHRRPD